jgi:CDP-diacylglycerol--glycerol-3-phosphate 3-phosphatidyltransferase
VTHGAIPDRLAEGTRAGLSPVARRLAHMGVSANAVTLAGGALTVLGAGFLAAGMPLVALIVLSIGTIADTLDGQVAKAAGGGSAFGAFLDSTVDRVADAALFTGTALLAVFTSQLVLLWWALVALVASSLVPYVRAKAEALGMRGAMGPAPREARIVIFLVGLAAWALLGLDALFVAGVVAVALLASITAVIRVAYVGRQLQAKGR